MWDLKDGILLLDGQAQFKWHSYSAVYVMEQPEGEDILASPANSVMSLGEKSRWRKHYARARLGDDEWLDDRDIIHHGGRSLIVEVLFTS
jgi:hypothetical protein